MRTTLILLAVILLPTVWGAQLEVNQEFTDGNIFAINIDDTLTSLRLTGTYTGSGNITVYLEGRGYAYSIASYQSTNQNQNTVILLDQAGATIALGDEITHTYQFREHCEETCELPNIRSEQLRMQGQGTLFIEHLTYQTTSVITQDRGEFEPELSVQAGEWNSTDWPHYFNITTNSSQVSSANTNLYYDLSLAPAHFWSNVRSDGGDIRVVQNDGTTEVAREIAYINHTAETGTLFFNSTGLSTSTETTWRIYYGNTDATDYAPSHEFGAHNVWDDRYAGVWHFFDPTDSNITDSTSNENTGLVNQSEQINPVSVSDGKLGPALYFSGAQLSRIPVSPSASLNNLQPMSACLWHNPAELDDEFADNIITGKTIGIQLDNMSSPGKIVSSVEADTYPSVTSIDNVTFDEWQHICVTFDDVGIAPTLYTNGVNTSNDQIVGAGAISDDSGNNLVFGAAGNPYARNYNGSMSEIRIYNTVLTTEWIETEYNNQNNPLTFWSTTTPTVPLTKKRVGGPTGWSWQASGVGLQESGGPLEWTWEETPTGLQKVGTPYYWEWQ